MRRASLTVGVLAVASLAQAACASAVDPFPGYLRATGAEHVSLVRAVADYYAVRERVFISGDVASLFAVYPKLAQGEDIREGINLDGFWAPRIHGYGVTDIDDDLEGYEAARFYVKGRSAVAFVHGWERWHYPRGDYTGLEFFTRIDLVNDGDRWIVELTDEQMMAEPPPRVPDR